MVEKKPGWKTAIDRARTRVAGIWNQNQDTSVETQHVETLHPLVKDYGNFAYAKNRPDQDASAEVLTKGVFIVADGVGSTAEGSSASHLACDTVAAEWIKTPAKEMSLTGTIAHLLGSIDKARAAIAAEATGDPEKADMATTIVVAKLWEGPNGEKKAIFGWVGDSKGGIQRKDGTLEQVTIDDDMASYFLSDPEKIIALQQKLSRVTSYDRLGTETIVMLDKPMVLNVYRDGRVEPGLVSELSERHFFAGRNFVSQSLAAHIKPEVHVEVRNISSGDQLVLSTDGESDNNTHNERAAILAVPGTASEKARNLGEAAVRKSWEPKTPNNARPKLDDTRVTVVKVA